LGFSAHVGEPIAAEDKKRLEDTAPPRPITPHRVHPIARQSAYGFVGAAGAAGAAGAGTACGTPMGGGRIALLLPDAEMFTLNRW